MKTYDFKQAEFAPSPSFTDENLGLPEGTLPECYGIIDLDQPITAGISISLLAIKLPFGPKDIDISRLGRMVRIDERKQPIP